MSMGGQYLSCMLKTLSLPVWSPITPKYTPTHTLQTGLSLQCMDRNGVPHKLVFYESTEKRIMREGGISDFSVTCPLCSVLFPSGL